VVARVLQPTVDELRKRGTPFTGLLYAGLALTSRGLRVVEFNARFGDPETQVLLPLLETPLSGLLEACVTESLHAVPPLRWLPGSAVTVVVAVEGYPSAPRTGVAVEGLCDVDGLEGVEVIHAGTALDAAGRVVASAGRVLSVTACGPSLAIARDRAYDAVARIQIEGSQHRMDIAAKAAQSELGTPVEP
jgi:phosphoribosylamine---glycine ligase